MPFTIGRRIVLGFALILILVAIVAGGGLWALRHTSESYDAALDGRKRLYAPALRAESEIRSANIENLRYLLDAGENYVAAKATRIALARGIIDSIIAVAPPAQTGPWRSVDSLVVVWSAAADEAVAARRAGNTAEVARIRTGRMQPL